MRHKQAMQFFAVLILMISLPINGCTFIFQKGRRVDVEKITKLKRELTDIQRAKKELEDRLKNEIKNNEVKVEMMAKGLVITFVAEVLFDSGKDKLRKESFQRLSKVANVLNTTVKDLNVGVEGHTDSDPIKRSGWKSNWELSTARALSVVHYLIDEQQVAPNHLSASGYGEYQPVATNDNKVGKQKNRRVEIVIFPKTEKEGR